MPALTSEAAEAVSGWTGFAANDPPSERSVKSPSAAPAPNDNPPGITGAQASGTPRNRTLAMSAEGSRQLQGAGLLVEFEGLRGGDLDPGAGFAGAGGASQQATPSLADSKRSLPSCADVEGWRRGSMVPSRPSEGEIADRRLACALHIRR